MKIGAENRKKVILTAVLSVIAIVLFVQMVVDGSTPSTPSASVAIANQPGAIAPATESRLAARKAAVKSSNLNPSLRTDLLRASEGIVYSGTGHNIFKAESDPPQLLTPASCAPLGGPSRGLRWCEPVLVPVRPVQPIPLKFFGFASKPGEPKKIFLSQGDSVFIAAEGDIVDRRYKVVHIDSASVQIQDVLNNYMQPIRLET
ncbi:MAG TPA: hypothetical protein VK699_00510 [Terriglobales bacterium]|jgi:hypothetical protein|nr:hypothetical protein [Terriglobales bacterium]